MKIINNSDCVIIVLHEIYGRIFSSLGAIWFLILERGKNFGRYL